MPDIAPAETNQRLRSADLITPLLLVQNIYFTYRDQNGKVCFTLMVDKFEFYQGERIALIGPNGAGKTTFLRIAALLQSAERSSIIFNNHPIKTNVQSLHYHRSTAFVPQRLVLYNGSVTDNVALGLKIRGASPSLIREKISAMLNAFKITHLAKRPVYQISGGEARRVMLARALVLSPKILFLDEPFADLDKQAKHALMNDFLPVLSQTGCTTIFITHNYEETYQLSDRLIVLFGGKIVQNGQTQEIFKRPASQEIADFLGLEKR